MEPHPQTHRHRDRESPSEENQRIVVVVRKPSGAEPMTQPQEQAGCLPRAPISRGRDRTPPGTLPVCRVVRPPCELRSVVSAARAADDRIAGCTRSRVEPAPVPRPPLDNGNIAGGVSVPRVVGHPFLIVWHTQACLRVRESARAITRAALWLRADEGHRSMASRIAASAGPFPSFLAISRGVFPSWSVTLGSTPCRSRS